VVGVVMPVAELSGAFPALLLIVRLGGAGGWPVTPGDTNQHTLHTISPEP
jgi:hypothetical protein